MHHWAILHAQPKIANASLARMSRTEPAKRALYNRLSIIAFSSRIAMQEALTGLCMPVSKYYDLVLMMIGGVVRIEQRE